MLTGQNGTISKNTLKTSMKSYLGQDVELIGVEELNKVCQVYGKEEKEQQEQEA